MTRLFILIIGLISSLAVLATACSGEKAREIQADLNQEFRLPVGQTASINGESLKIKFETVVADSRCALGVECIWAGEAQCQTQVVFNQVEAPLILTVSGSSISQSVYDGYNLVFNLEPYPQAGQTIDPAGYVLVLKVTR